MFEPAPEGPPSSGVENPDRTTIPETDRADRGEELENHNEMEPEGQLKAESSETSSVGASQEIPPVTEQTEPPQEPPHHFEAPRLPPERVEPVTDYTLRVARERQRERGPKGKQ